MGAPIGISHSAGIGRIGQWDFVVAISPTCQARSSTAPRTVGRRKIESAFEDHARYQSFVELDRHETALSSENALRIVKDYD